MYVLYVCVGGGTCARAADAFIAVVRQSAKCSCLVWVRQSAFAGKIVQLMGRAWVMMIQAHEHVFFGDVHSGNLMVKISYTNDDVSFVPTWIDFGAAVLRREVFLLQRYLREKGIPPHSIGIADGGVQGVDDAPGPFSLACSPLCWKSSLTWESCQRCILTTFPSFLGDNFVDAMPKSKQNYEYTTQARGSKSTRLEDQMPKRLSQDGCDTPTALARPPPPPSPLHNLNANYS